MLPVKPKVVGVTTQAERSTVGVSSSLYRSSSSQLSAGGRHGMGESRGDPAVCNDQPIPGVGGKACLKR